MIDRAATKPTVIFGQADAQQSQLVSQSSPYPGRKAVCAARGSEPLIKRVAIRQKPSQAGAEHLLLFGKCEIHDAEPSAQHDLGNDVALDLIGSGIDRRRAVVQICRNGHASPGLFGPIGHPDRVTAGKTDA